MNSQPTARDQILSRVRAALADISPEEAAPPSGATAPRRVAVPDLIGLFAERVRDYLAVVVRCEPEELLGAVANALPAGASVVVPAGLSVTVPDALTDDGTLSASHLDRIDAVVTDAVVGIAETGTIVLDHGPGQGRRALTLVPDRHICIVRSTQIVTDVPDAIAALSDAIRGGRALTWISGPSATSDIELERVEGVHGPRHLHVIIVHGS